MSLIRFDVRTIITENDIFIKIILKSIGIMIQSMN